MSGTHTSSTWKTAPAPIPDSDIKQQFSSNVVVVGLGHSGTPAVRAAVEAGASVIGIEKMERAKYYAWGNDVGHINSKFLASKGVPKVDLLEFFNEWMRRSGNRANPKLIMEFCKKSGEAFDWYTDPCTNEQLSTVRVAHWPLGKRFRGEISGQKFWAGTAQFAAMFYKTNFSLSDAVTINQKYAEKKGAILHFGMDAQQLIMNGTSVVGVIAKDKKGNYVKYNANKGVILAAGDFGGNKEMCEDLLPDIKDLFDDDEGFRSMGRTGRGIQMGVWAGGRLEARPIATMGGNFGTLTGVLDTFGSLWIDAKGKRFCNEGFGDPVFAGFPVAQEKHTKNTIIFDSNIIENLQSTPPAHMSFFINDESSKKRLIDSMSSAREAKSRGFPVGNPEFGVSLYAADTLEELADYIGFTDTVKRTFLESIKRYNQFCDNLRDEDFGKDPVLLHPIKYPPFYAEPINTSRIGNIMVTCGGLLTDEYQNVLNIKREPIPGLYATGNCCGRRFGPQYSTPIAGVSIGIALTLGREVGRIVAEL